MERIERVIVHVDEALNMAEKGDAAHLRLSLLLLDSAAELLMHRACESIFAFEEPFLRMFKPYEQAKANGISLTEAQVAHFERLRSDFTSKSRRGKVRKYFDEKARFLRSKGKLEEPHVRVLKKLHQYRNEAYHRDRVRPATLASGVKIYAYLVCVMLPHMNPTVAAYPIDGKVPEALRPYLDGPVLGRIFDIANNASKAFLERTGFTKQGDLGRTLSAHLLGRVSDLESDIDFCRTSLPDVLSREDFMLLVQIDDDQWKPEYLGLDHLRTLTFPVNMKTIASWKHEARGLSRTIDTLDAFSKFADTEDKLEPIEEKVDRFATELSREIDRQIDEARGR